MLGLARLHPWKLRFVAFAKYVRYTAKSGGAEAGPWRFSLKCVVLFSLIAPDEFLAERSADESTGRRPHYIHTLTIHGPRGATGPESQERFGGAHPVASSSRALQETVTISPARRGGVLAHGDKA